MLKNIVRLDCLINGKTFTFLSDIEPNTSEVKEALFQFQKIVGQIEDNAQAQRAAAEENKVVDLPEGNQHV